MAAPKRSDRKVPASHDIDLACESLEDLRRRLKDIVRLGGGEPNVGLLTAAADDCADAVLACDDAAEIRMVNGAAARLTGLSTRALQALTIWDITYPSSQGDFDVLWKEFLRAGRQRGSYTIRYSDGSPVDVAYCAAVNVLPQLHVTVLRRLEGRHV
jgi:PAS domain S-box-containing protein